jgi:hypothetical protein
MWLGKFARTEGEMGRESSFHIRWKLNSVNQRALWNAYCRKFSKWYLHGISACVESLNIMFLFTCCGFSGLNMGHASCCIWGQSVTLRIWRSELESLKAQEFYFRHCVHTSCVAYPTLCQMCTGVYRLAFEVDLSPSMLRSTDFNNVHMCTVFRPVSWPEPS